MKNRFEIDGENSPPLIQRKKPRLGVKKNTKFSRWHQTPNIVIRSHIRFEIHPLRFSATAARNGD